jgi:LDH2 family malate/lactate/ureidoglycolate dehydrogenase
MPKFKAQHLRSLVTNIAVAAGVPQTDAQTFAHVLVDADVQGVSTHGVSRLSIYMQRIAKGLIDPKAALGVDRSFGSVLALDAGNGLGQIQAMKALDRLMPLAKSNGVAAATIRNSQHFGTLSFYCNRAADENMVLLAMSNCEPSMSPAGGYQPFFGTNPIATSFPTGKGYNVKIDMATAVTARGNIIMAQKKGQAIPEGWALDPEGNPTTDASQALLGTVLTMAGHKGYALALMIEVFSSVLSGSSIGPAIGSMYKNMDRKQDVGHFFCLLNIEAFLDLDEFKQRLDETIDKIKASKKRPGTDEILIPGERSSRKAAENEADGVTVSPEVTRELQTLCEQLNVPFALAEV